MLCTICQHFSALKQAAFVASTNPLISSPPFPLPVLLAGSGRQQQLLTVLVGSTAQPGRGAAGINPYVTATCLLLQQYIQIP